MPYYRPFETFRFVLALLVVVSHTWDLTFTEDNILVNVGIGNVAVMGFFILSGFIITEVRWSHIVGQFGSSAKVYSGV